ncbi:MAG TPA: HAMP domain-containing sensor histidine kinase [Chloroflexi bacterium]|nr:HAMP domain-containing sensor histidine kinase [Chloroflexota bacterium]
MFRSLNTRLLLSYVIIIVVCLTVVGLGLLLFVRASPLWTTAAFLRLEAAARAALPTLRQAGPLETLSPQQVRALLARIAEEQEVRVLLLDSTGAIRFDSEGAWESAQLKEVHRAPTTQGRLRGNFVAPTGGRWAFVGQVLPAIGGTHYVAVFVSPQARLLMLAWFVENLLPPLVRAGTLALVLSVLLALLVSRSVAAPLKRVSKVAEALARGETGRRSVVSGPTEVRALARSFNTMADRVEATQRAQRDFVANVSHDLKTPLTSIHGFSQALLDGTASTPEATARAARVIHEEAEWVQRLVNELLVLARFDAGQMVMARQPVEVGSVLRGCIEKLTPQARQAGVTLEVNVSRGLTVVGDADRLTQVFSNVVDNAIAHTPAGGKVTLEARQAEGAGAVEVAITDTGEGIPAEDLPRIFERFYQVDKSRQHSRGTGLGLAIAKEIVKAHGGAIGVESVTGLGTRFTIRLQAAPIEADERR